MKYKKQNIPCGPTQAGLYPFPTSSDCPSAEVLNLAQTRLTPVSQQSSLPNELALQRSLTLCPLACQMHPPLYIISVSVSSQMGWGVLDITAGPSQAVTLMRDTWMSGAFQSRAEKKRKEKKIKMEKKKKMHSRGRSHAKCRCCITRRLWEWMWTGSMCNKLAPIQM